MPVDTRQVDDIERSYCDCLKCQAGCHAMPGFLSTGDIQKIGEFLSEDCESPEFLEEFFEASEGAKCITRDGELVQIGTIVPRQVDGGSCVFWDEEDGCLIHEVSPFGCRNFNICDDEDKDGHRKSTRGLLAIMQDRFYNSCREILVRRKRFARPLGLRKLHLLELLEAITK